MQLHIFFLPHLKNGDRYNLDAINVHFFPHEDVGLLFLMGNLLKCGMYTLNMDTKRNYWLPEYCS